MTALRHPVRICLLLAGLQLAFVAGVQALQSTEGSQPTPREGAQPNVLRIGIPMMANSSTRSVNGRLQRDWLLRAFEPGKKKKGKPLPALRYEAVALESDSYSTAFAEAREKNCDYVLFTTLVELREPGDREPSPGTIGTRTMPGVQIGRDPLSTYPDPSVRHDPVHFAVVEYRLQRVGNSEARMTSSVSGQDHNDENGTVQSLLFIIVNRVKDELREPESAGPN